MPKSLKILILSTFPPEHSAGLGANVMTALLNGGHDVTYISRYKGSSAYSHVSVEESVHDKNKRIKNILPNQLKKTLINLISKIKESINGYNRLVYKNELHPFIDPNRIIQTIGTDTSYDLVITLFWVNFINSTSLVKLYNLLKCPILIYSVDLAPMTGGCYYFYNCDHYQSECGDCPLLEKNSNLDQTHINFLVKKANYKKISCAFLGNSWMNNFSKQSNLFANIFHTNVVISENEFYPRNQRLIKNKFGFSADQIILMARSWNLKRKGMEYIIGGVTNLFNSLSFENKKRLIVITIGDERIKEELKKSNISVIHFGFVDKPSLIQLYQVSTYFMSASTDDAGPSMINQALMCGTPVVCFNNGTAIDVIHNKISGFKTGEISIQNYSNILKEAFEFALTDKYEELRRSTRETAVRECSSTYFLNRIESIYDEMLHQQQSKEIAR